MKKKKTEWNDKMYKKWDNCSFLFLYVLDKETKRRQKKKKKNS